MRGKGSIRVAIYGAGAAGVQLASALMQSKEFKTKFFIDDNAALHGKQLMGLTINAPSMLKSLIEKERVDRLIIAIPSLDQISRDRLMEQLANIDCDVLAMPSYVDLIREGNLEKSLKKVVPADVLGRDHVAIDLVSSRSIYQDKIILISGAGGTIGSELCRQLLSCGVSRLVLFDHSEFALYNLVSFLETAQNPSNTDFSVVLGSVTDSDRVRNTLVDYEVDIVFHVAAYKHVPLVEGNEVEGVKNNVIGTKVIIDAVEYVGSISRFLLVSTDKAVRPTNVMGASKRVSELLVQDIQTRSLETVYSIVRFGNVLGSSGSVMPLFQRQIEAGGPVTITHPDVTRYFMTIEEAAKLILISASIAEGGEVFLLDMGKPVLILDLARRMIELSGRSPKNGQTSGEEIPIAYTGLRPGEKLYEELLIDAEAEYTTHPKIFRAREKQLSEADVEQALESIQNAIRSNNTKLVRKVLCDWVEDYANGL